MQHHLLVFYQGQCHKKLFHMRGRSRSFIWHALSKLRNEALRFTKEVWSIHVNTVDSYNKSVFSYIDGLSHIIAGCSLVARYNLTCSAQDLGNNTIKYTISCDWGYNLHRQAGRQTSRSYVELRRLGYETKIHALANLTMAQVDQMTELPIVPRTRLVHWVEWAWDTYQTTKQPNCLQTTQAPLSNLTKAQINHMSQQPDTPRNLRDDLWLIRHQCERIFQQHVTAKLVLGELFISSNTPGITVRDMHVWNNALGSWDGLFW